jgi:hypothetical protein
LIGEFPNNNKQFPTMSRECFGSKSSHYEYDPDEILLNSQVSKSLQKEYKKDSEYSKILLLGFLNFFSTKGPGSSGKSTIFKQMKIINLNGYTDEQKISYKTIIFFNIVTIFASTVEYCESKEMEIDEKCKKVVEWVKAQNKEADNQFGKITEKDLLELWNDKSMQEASQKGNEYHLLDSCS